jgi:MerR family transcriptional regulator, light-induced transcriptional regulator
MGAVLLEENDNRGASLHIQSVARLTNLSVDTIRAWEKRYAAVSPTRGPARQRLFSSEDVARLVLLKEAVDSGESISKVASLSTSDLRSFVQAEHMVGDADDAVILRLLSRVRALDTYRMAGDLTTASLSRSAVEFADDIISPLMMEITAGARSVDESTTHELVLCECIHSVSSLLFAKYARHPSSPRIIFLTLPGERHSVSPLLAALACAEAGYRSLFAGTEIAPQHVEALVRSMHASALGVYVGVHSDDALRLILEVKKRLPDLPLFVGASGLRFAPELRPTQTLRDFIGALELLQPNAEEERALSS